MFKSFVHFFFYLQLSITLAKLTIEFLGRSGLSLRTQESYEFTLLPFLAQYGRFPIDTITRQEVLAYLESLVHLSYTTHHRHQAIITALFNFAISQGYLNANPAAKLQRRKPNLEKGESNTDQIIRYLTTAQLDLLYQLVIPDVRLHAIIVLLHRTGARIGELLALNLDDIDLTEQKFQVIGKGNKKRWCFYSIDAALVLEKYIHYYRYKEVKALFTAYHPLTKKVTRLSYRRVHTLWQKLTDTHLLLKGVRLHDIRHSFATERVGLISIEELRALMGHSNIQTTLRYQKVTSLKAEEVAKKALKILIDDTM